MGIVAASHKAYSGAKTTQTCGASGCSGTGIVIFSVGTPSGVYTQTQALVGTLRASASTTDYVQCTVSSASVYCVAQAGTVTHSCQSTDPKFISAAQTFQGDSFISFNTLSTNPSVCTNLSVSNGSSFAPKQP